MVCTELLLGIKIGVGYTANMLIYDAETGTAVESAGFPLPGGKLIYLKTV